MQCVSHDVKTFRHAMLLVKAIHDTAGKLPNTTIVEILKLDRGERGLPREHRVRGVVHNAVLNAIACEENTARLQLEFTCALNFTASRASSRRGEQRRHPRHCCIPVTNVLKSIPNGLRGSALACGRQIGPSLPGRCICRRSAVIHAGCSVGLLLRNTTCEFVPFYY